MCGVCTDHGNYMRFGGGGGMRLAGSAMQSSMSRTSSTTTKSKNAIKEIVVRKEFPETWIWKEFENIGCVKKSLL